MKKITYIKIHYITWWDMWICEWRYNDYFTTHYSHLQQMGTTLPKQVLKKIINTTKRLNKFNLHHYKVDSSLPYIEFHYKNHNILYELYHTTIDKFIDTYLGILGLNLYFDEIKLVINK